MEEFNLWPWREQNIQFAKMISLIVFSLILLLVLICSSVGWHHAQVQLKVLKDDYALKAHNLRLIKQQINDVQKQDDELKAKQKRYDQLTGYNAEFNHLVYTMAYVAHFLPKSAYFDSWQYQDRKIKWLIKADRSIGVDQFTQLLQLQSFTALHITKFKTAKDRVEAEISGDIDRANIKAKTE